MMPLFVRLFVFLFVLIFPVVSLAQMTVVFTVKSGVIKEKEAKKLIEKKIHGRMSKIHERNGKSLYEVVVNSLDEIPDAAAAFTERTPEILGVWNWDGSLYGWEWQSDELGVRTLIRSVDPETGQPTNIPYEFKKTKYLDSLPDIEEFSDDGTEIRMTRRTVPAQVHKFFGSGDKTFPE